MEVYVDDMLVKSVLQEDHVEDLQETFRTLKKYGMRLNPAKCAFGVASECEEAFEQLKKYLTSAPLLSRTVPGEALYLYLVVSSTAVSVALVREEDGVQKPVYFVSRALRGAEERYPQMEKLAFALTIASRKLRLYFQAHTIRVLTEYPLKKILRKLDLPGRLANWAIKLGEFDIEFLPRNAIKGQVLADFLAEFTNLPMTQEWQKDETWVVYVDGSSTRKNGGACVVLITPDGEELYSSLKLAFKTTNNEAEYEAVLAGLGLARELGAEFVELQSDSQVIVGHIRGEFEARGRKMKQYLSKVQTLQNAFKKFCIMKILREENERADQLDRMASTTTSNTEEPIQTLARPVVTDMVSVSVTETVPEWQRSIREYLEQGVPPLDKKSATQVRTRAARFTIINGTLYKRDFMLPLLKCISKEEHDYVLREIHEGICGKHSGVIVLAHKAIRAGFYWPNMTRDSVDIVGPLPRGKGGVRFAVVAVDYFTKWAEVEALVNITAKSIERFLWKNVVCRCGIPHAFITANRKQFDYESFREWCAKLHIRNYYSSPAHPQANGQVEATNKTILKILKKKLGDRKEDWVDDLPKVLWAYRTTKRVPTKETPDALAFKTEAVIPAEIGSGSYRVESFHSETNDEGLKLHLDLL
ncbi:uncharacterized protein LOC132174218 [Corylus avellana]|uniref:uncharacterized protein LOC132174218 n=1 Tax=Corylus avellana TaxID=13451 RepID=UPI00286C5BB8|nr:uncharacterized protein LOC132174218 [Corylus avellana]